jgi:ATP-dependent Lhr-like helicase
MQPDHLLFHPLIAQWFSERFGEATAVQRAAWPVISGGSHVLMSAPTGSGKTLSAFLWGLNQLIGGEWEGGAVRVLYVSPLKALNNDIRINLLNPLSELRDRFSREGLSVPKIDVQTRSGDTTPAARQRMLRHPPEILITTPESLNLLLSSRGGREMLRKIMTVILDEIHAVMSNKRGTHLMTAVERLVPLSGEFQRIALSATVKPMARVAEFVGGYELLDGQGEGVYRKRRVEIVQVEGDKRYDVRVRSPQGLDANTTTDAWWDLLVGDLRQRIERNQSTLLFANSRRFTEKLARLINASEEGEERIAYSHHGSLSREVRHVVEKKLKSGELRAIVATSSLELGIDIGELDEVVLVQAPLSVSSALQRVGRAGHGVHEVSRARIYPLFKRDYLTCAVMAREVVNRDIEELHVPLAPLDVLAQIIISMTCMESWIPDTLYNFIRTFAPYHHLQRTQFDLVLQMLSGRYAETRIRELQPRLIVDPVNGSIRCREGSIRILYQAGGTIPDRGYFHLRVRDSGAKIGELDEEFVWERSIGDLFTFGTQHWRIVNIDHQNVEVVPVTGRAAMAPFWKADFGGRDFHLSERIALALEGLDEQLRGDQALHTLVSDYHMNDASARILVEFLRDQRRATGTGLPHRHRVVAEHLHGLEDSPDSRQIVVHAIWGGQVILPLCTALAQAWEELHGTVLRLYHDDDSILMHLPDGAEGRGVRDILGMVTVENVEALLRRRLEQTGIFGARFRENAARALLLPKKGFDRRTPLWLNRIRAKKLMQSVKDYEDFPILTETWRTCLRDEFDVGSLKQILDELGRGIIDVLEVHLAETSPFAAEILHWQVHTHMYQDDTPEPGTGSKLSGDILRDVVFSDELRPRISSGIVESFVERLKRLSPGYAPDSPLDLYDWIRERILIPVDEMKDLLAAVERDHGLGSEEVLDELAGRLLEILLPGASEPAITTYDGLLRVLRTLFISGDEGEDGFTELLSEWLRYEGPVPDDRVSACFGIEANRLRDVVDSLIDGRAVVRDRFGDSDHGYAICDSENMERLLRMMRRERREPFRPLPLSRLPLFLAHHQGLVGPEAVQGQEHGERGSEGSPDSMEERIVSLQDGLEMLFGYPARTEIWETELIPARVHGYEPELLDLLMQRTDLVWFGTGRARLSFCLASDLQLFLPGREDEVGDTITALFPDSTARYGFQELHRISGTNARELSAQLWELVWKGQVSTDRFDTLRRGIENGFTGIGPEPAARKGRVYASGRRRWHASGRQGGSWFVLQRSDPADLLDEQDMQRDRARQLLTRYGVVFRELLERELPGLRWRDVFRSLRIMELSGEVLAGYFFEHIPGLQFASHAAFRSLQRPLPGEAVYWMNAADPASLCGVSFEGLDLDLPRRVPGNYLVFQGERPVLVLGRYGSELQMRTDARDNRIQSYLGVYRALLQRSVRPLPVIRVERINGEPSLESPYKDQLLDFGFERGYRDLVLRRKYR